MSDKNLSKLDFMEVLQQEYFAAEIRSKIHHKISNKKYWKKMMVRKKEKIKSISNELDIKSIFDSDEYYQEVKRAIFPDKHNRVPKFEMSNEELELYFADDSQVKVFGENGEFYLGTIKTSMLSKNILSIKKRGGSEVKLIFLTRVMRLL